MCKTTISPCLAFLVLFVGLKLADLIHWSWLWVLSPLWLPVLVLAAGVVVVILVTCVAALAVFVGGAVVDAWRNRRP